MSPHRTAALHTLQVAGLEERIAELQLELDIARGDHARCQRENAALRVELCESVAARAREVDQAWDDGHETMAETPRAKAERDRDRTTVPIQNETMATIVDGRLK